jgi:hypothetical protein
MYGWSYRCHLLHEWSLGVGGIEKLIAVEAIKTIKFSTTYISVMQFPLMRQLEFDK